MKTIKVVHLVEDLKIGGLERVIESIVTGLDKDRYDAEVWCLAHGGEIAEDLIEKGLIVKILGMNSYYNPLKIIALSRLMRKEKIKILHIHGYFAGTFGRLAAIVARVPIIIYHVHSTYYGYKKRNILTEKLLSFFSDNIVCISKAVRNFVVNIEGINEKKTCLIYNGIEPPEAFDELSPIKRSAFGLSKEDFVAITVASLTPHKGHHVLIEAMKRVSGKHSNLGLLITGDGPLRKSLDEQLKGLPFLTKILFARERKDVISLLKSADVFVLPSVEREGLGIALLEAMAVGLPVIGSRLGGIPEVIQDNINGFLFTPGNHEELAAVIEKIIDDNVMRNEMGRRGRKMYEQTFTVAIMIRKIEQLYDSNAGKTLEIRMSSRSYNILYLSSFGDFRGGGQISLFNLVKNLDKSLFRPHVILPSNETMAVRLLQHNIDVSILAFVKISPKNIFKSFILLKNLYKLTNTKKIDIIHTDGPRNTFYAGLVAKTTKVPLVFHVRAHNKDRYDRILYRLSSKIILVADALRSRFDWVNNNGKFITIYNGIDLSEFVKAEKTGSIRTEYKIGSQDLVITFTGRIEKLKGQKYLIQACGEIKERLKKFHILLVGKVSDSSYFEECKQEAVESGIQDQVIFTGHKDTVSHILPDTDIFVSPSLFEAFPRSVIEAMGTGKPVIVTDVGGCPEAVEEGISGFVVKAKDSIALGDRILRLANDPWMRERIGNAARMRAETMFGIEQNVMETERVYDDLLGIE